MLPKRRRWWRPIFASLVLTIAAAAVTYALAPAQTMAAIHTTMNKLGAR
jgi:hypothetical protein